MSFPKEYPCLFTDAMLENESEPSIPVIMDYSLHRLFSPRPWHRDVPRHSSGLRAGCTPGPSAVCFIPWASSRSVGLL